jgi:hypothetical protein
MLGSDLGAGLHQGAAGAKFCDQSVKPCDLDTLGAGETLGRW